MAYGIKDYASGYSTPQSQGYQGQQGADQQPQPDSIFDPQRAPMWKPPPSSTASQPQQQGSNFADAAARGTAAPGSPVTATGQIAPATPQAPSTPGQPPQPQTPGQDSNQTSSANRQVTGPPLTTPPQGQDPFAAMGGGVWTGQQWVPKNHPLAQPFLTQQTTPTAPNPNSGVQPNPAQYSPYGPYPGRPAGTTYTPDQLPQINVQPYQQTQFQGYNPVNQSGIQNQQNQLLSQLLSNPSLSPAIVNQIKAGQKDSALSMMDQLQSRASQDAAARGTNLDGQLVSTQNDIGSNTLSSLLDSYRNTDIQAALQNRQDQLGALSASENVLSGQVGRAGDQFRSYLGGQQAQSDENQRGFGNQMSVQEMALNRAAQQAGLNQAGVGSNLDAYKTDLGAFYDYLQNQTPNRQLDVNQQLGNAGIDVDKQRLAEQGRQFNMGNQLDWASLLNNMVMGRSSLGLDYAKLEQQGQDSVMRNLLGL